MWRSKKLTLLAQVQFDKLITVQVYTVLHLRHGVDACPTRALFYDRNGKFDKQCVSGITQMDRPRCFHNVEHFRNSFCSCWDIGHLDSMTTNQADVEWDDQRSHRLFKNSHNPVFCPKPQSHPLFLGLTAKVGAKFRLKILQWLKLFFWSYAPDLISVTTTLPVPIGDNLRPIVPLNTPSLEIQDEPLPKSIARD